jgi:hypothetical protein
MVPLLAFWMDYSLALLFPGTTQATEDLPHWLTENESPPRSKMSIAPELVSPIDSQREKQASVTSLSWRTSRNISLHTLHAPNDLASTVPD